MAVWIATDSTADLPEKLVSQYKILVTPLNVHFGEETLKDGMDIWSDEFYHRLKNDPFSPSTSQPAPGEFIRVYREVARPGDTIISIHISARLSGTIDSARIAAELLAPDYQVITVDSRSTTMGLGLITLAAARLAQTGAGVAAILAAIEAYCQAITVNFTVTDLEYLHRNGRIGKAGCYLGSLLNIKPLLTLRDGMIMPLEKIRGNFSKVVERMMADFEARLGKQPLITSVVSGNAPENAALLAQVAAARLNIIEAYPVVAGPIIGTHTGPSLVGMVAAPLL
jgi:DegV family protein with EDD domain